MRLYLSLYLIYCEPFAEKARTDFTVFLLLQTEETMLSNGKYSAKIIISPEENVTIICSAENKLGREVHSLNVSASKY